MFFLTHLAKPSILFRQYLLLYLVIGVLQRSVLSLYFFFIPYILFLSCLIHSHILYKNTMCTFMTQRLVSLTEISLLSYKLIHITFIWLLLMHLSETYLNLNSFSYPSSLLLFLQCFQFPHALHILPIIHDSNVADTLDSCLFFKASVNDSL